MRGHDWQAALAELRDVQAEARACGRTTAAGSRRIGVVASRLGVAMFRFTIRDVLWLTVVVALAVGWWLERRGLRTQLRAVELQEQKAQQELLLSKIDELEFQAARRYNEARDRPSWDSSKAKSKELGAPQTKPLPN